MKKSRVLVLLALLLAIISTFFLYQYIEGLRKQPEVQVKYGNVVVALTDIPQHTKITEAMLELKSVPEEAIHKDAVKAVADIVGLTTKMDILSGEQVFKSKVASKEEKTGLSYQIPENMRAIVVPTSEVSGLAGYLVAGDRVDILVNYTDRPGPGTPPALTTAPATQTPITTPGTTTAVTTPVTTTAPATRPAATSAPIEGYVETITQFQNIEVLAIGIKPTLDENGKLVENTGVPTSVTLLVTPQQAEVMSYMLNSGSFQMTLRNPVDGLKVPLDHFGTDNFDDWRNR
ncbi:Flp pilus assembly protein CpaB [Clostridiaceae bacterium HFYG-1003]|nr:Flp pilus assembly protein CpaB [Clostridiaceae bacterium HFYG-1003]